MSTAKPIPKKEFKALMANLGLGPGNAPFVVAVSGGADSMALSLLMAEFGACHFVTFDHGLRKNSSREAEKIHGWFKKLGLDHTVLRWEGKKPKTGVEHAGREARYQALGQFCVQKKAKFLLVAHHLEDQAETFLMRVMKGSGIDGLAAMDPLSRLYTNKSVRLVRPLLSISKTRLCETLKQKGQPWVEDPTNECLDFTRVKIRKILENSNSLDAKDLAELARRLGVVKSYLEDLTQGFLFQAFGIRRRGYALLDGAEFLKADDQLKIRALSKILGFISQEDYPPRYEKLKRLAQEMSEENFRGATLSGCQIQREGTQFLIFREISKITHRVALEPERPIAWDNRFLVSTKEQGLMVAPLGQKGWEQVLAQNPALKQNDLPHPVRVGLPAFFRDEKVFCVPHLNFSVENCRAEALFRPKRPLF